jgi:hypothetical protein
MCQIAEILKLYGLIFIWTKIELNISNLKIVTKQFMWKNPQIFSENYQINFFAINFQVENCQSNLLKYESIGVENFQIKISEL